MTHAFGGARVTAPNGSAGHEMVMSMTKAAPASLSLTAPGGRSTGSRTWWLRRASIP